MVVYTVKEECLAMIGGPKWLSFSNAILSSLMDNKNDTHMLALIGTGMFEELEIKYQTTFINVKNELNQTTLRFI